MAILLEWSLTCGALCAVIRDSYFDEHPLGIRFGEHIRKLAALLITKEVCCDRSAALRIPIFYAHALGACSAFIFLHCRMRFGKPGSR